WHSASRRQSKVAAVGDIERTADESAIGRRTSDRGETGIGSVGLHDVEAFGKHGRDIKIAVLCDFHSVGLALVGQNAQFDNSPLSSAALHRIGVTFRPN